MRTLVQQQSRPKASFSLARSSTAAHPQRQPAVPGLATACGHDFSRVSVYATSRARPQAKLAVSSPGDQYEQEADRVAEAVIAGASQPASHVARGVQPKLYRAVLRPQDMADSIIPPGAETESEAPAAGSPEEVQRSATAAGAAVDVPFEQSLQQAVQRGGERLTPSTRSFMESRFGRDFSSVQIHRDAQADTLSRGINARAFTLGDNIFFARSQYQPHSQEGQRLLAHELTHVVQQSAGRVSRQIQRATSCSSYPSYDASKSVSTYNCAGLALRTYKFTSPPSAVISEIAANFIGPHTPSGGKCGPGKVKFWLWEYDIRMEDDLGTVVAPTWQDFHIVAGRTDALGADPSDVYTKNGARPVYGPGTGPDFRPPARDRATTNDPSETPITTPAGRPVFKVRSNISESITCADCHP